ncbi:MAG TPA: alpha-amylase family protein [Clostridiaceae bacterium]
MANTYWYNKQLRMVQTVLRETDIINYDADKVVAYLDSVRANCIIVNGGGVVDFFPNTLELSNVNPFMTKENMLGDLVKKAHEKDIKVMVRVDFRGVDKARYEMKPHWFTLKEDLSPKLNPQGLYPPCYNSEYANEHGVRYIKNIMTLYDIDGVWENSVGFGVGPCYCMRCRKKYKKDLGKAIPKGTDYYSKDFDEYRVWKAKCADDHLRLLRDSVKSFGEDKAFCAEIFGMFHAKGTKDTGIDLYNAKEHFDFLVSPTFLTVHNPKSNYDILSYGASSIRFMKAIHRDKQAVMLYGNNGTLWRYVKDPTVESKIWLWEGVSVGANFWNCMFNGQYPGGTYDNRNAYMEKEIYSYLEDNEAILGNQIPAQDIGIYFSKATRDYFGSDDEDKDGYGVYIKGVERVLLENHHQYSFIPDIDFTLEKIKSLKVLILPNCACISNEHIETIKSYVKEGGGLIASYETSLYDERGNKREDFALGELFGLSYTGIKKDTAMDSYQWIEDKNHPVLEGITDTSLVINGGNTLICTKENKDYTSVCSYIPQIYNQPPEKAWIREMQTEFPTIIAGRYGKGRVIYFSNEQDKLCHTNGHEDYTTIYNNSIKWAGKGRLSISSNAPESVHVALTNNNKNEGQYVLSLVNLTSAPRRPIKEILPVYDLKIELKLGKKLADYKVLKSQGRIEVTYEDDIIKIFVEKLQDFTSIYINTL